MRLQSNKSFNQTNKRYRDEQWNPRANLPLTFKKFILLSEGIPPDEAPKKYQSYLISFLSAEIKRFYDAYENLPFFREKYHPHYLSLEYELFKQSFLNNNKLVVENIAAGKFANVQLNVSFELVYGKYTESSENESYGMNQWAYEVVFEKTPEEITMNRLLLKSPLESVLLVDIPDYAFKMQIIDILKNDIEKFEIYMAEQIGGRTVFVCLDQSVDIEAVSRKLNEQNHFIGETILKFEPCKPIKDKIRVRVCPPICSHPVRIQRDLHLTAKLIKKLDGEVLDGMDVDNVNDFLSSLSDDLTDQQRLDLQVFYLRRVHYYCYYGRMKCPSYMELWDKFGPGHMKVDIKNDIKTKEDEEGLVNNEVKVNFASWQNPNVEKLSNDGGEISNNIVADEPLDDWESLIESEVSKNGHSLSKAQVQWVKDVEDFANIVLETDIKPPKMTENSEAIEKRWEQFCHVHTLADSPERFRCKLCQKLFSDSKYVWKHLKLKHSDKYDDIIVQSGLADMKDLFFWAHGESRTNPFESLVHIPPLLDSQKRNKPVKDYSKDASRMALENWNLSQSKPGFGFKGDVSYYNPKKAKEYHDFDKPDPKQSIAVFTPEVYSRPTVKYDDL